MTDSPSSGGVLASIPPQDLGHPGYPSPWTTSQPLEGLRDEGTARIVCLAPSVNLTPSGGAMVPVPYMIYDLCNHMDGYSTRTFYTGQRVLRACSRTTHVHGDEAGTGGGMKSGTVGGICEPIGHARRVRVESSEVVRHLDRFWMEHRNTVGEAIFVRDLSTSTAPPLSDPVPGSARVALSGLDAGRASAGVGDTTVYTWSNFGKLAAGEEIAGGGPEDPVADLAVVGTGIIFLGAALWNAAHPDTVRVSRIRNPEFCLVGPYGEIDKICNKGGGETHHIVPDMVYRLGARPESAEEKNSRENRIPRGPTFNEGISICLTEGEHRTDEEAIHKTLNPAINALGAATPEPFRGTAPMPEIVTASLLALSRVDGVSDRCRELAAAATLAQAASTASQPGRAVTSPQRLSLEARSALLLGHY